MKRIACLLFLVGFTACSGTVDSDAPVSGAAGTSPGSGGTDASGGSGGAGGTGATGASGGSGGTGTTDGAGGTGGTSGASGNGGLTECPDAPGPPMVLLPEGYCIDSTEVTRAQYADWLATAPSIVGQKLRCKWNTSFEPANYCEEDYRANGVSCGPGECPDAPQGCIDWCDAYAYCKAVGKRLCGRIGGGEVDEYHPFDDPNQSQWFNACSSGGTYAFPYGDSYDADKCHTDDDTSYGLYDVGSFPLCQSPVAGYSGVYDLSGNLPEWEDACRAYDNPNAPSDGSADLCRLRGGSGSQSQDKAACAADFETDRVGPGPAIRCCYP